MIICVVYKKKNNAKRIKLATGNVITSLDPQVPDACCQQPAASPLIAGSLALFYSGVIEASISEGLRKPWDCIRELVSHILVSHLHKAHGAFE